MLDSLCWIRPGGNVCPAGSEAGRRLQDVPPHDSQHRTHDNAESLKASAGRHGFTPRLPLGESFPPQPLPTAMSQPPVHPLDHVAAS